MPDPSALYPQPPQPNQGLLTGDPTKMIGMIGALNQNALFQQTFAARKALGSAYSNALRPDGTIDETELMKGAANAGFLAPDAVSAALAQKQQRIQNASSQLEQNVKQNQFLATSVGALDPDKATPDTIWNWAVTTARNVDKTALPSDVIFNYAKQVINDPQGIAHGVRQLQNFAMGPAAASSRVAGPRDPGTGAPTEIPLGQANLAGTGGGTTGSVTTGLPPGQGEAQTQEAQSGQTAAAGLQTAASQIPMQHTQLDLMKNDLKVAEDKFGPTLKYEKLANVVANRVIGIMPTMTKEQVAATESFDKIAKQIAMTQAGTLHATDQTLSTALGANPNTDLSAYGSAGIINMLHGNLDYMGIVAKEWNRARAAGVTPDKYWQWLDKFNQSADPRVFQFLRMNKEQQTTLLKNIDDKSQFERNLVAADQRGWIKLPKAEQ